MHCVKPLAIQPGTDWNVYTLFSISALVWFWWSIKTPLRWDWEGSVSPWQRQLLSVLWQPRGGTTSMKPLPTQTQTHRWHFWCLPGQLFPKRCTVCMQCKRKPHVNCKTRKTECHITPLPQNPSSRQAELNKIITVTRSSSLSGQGCFRKTTTRVTLCRRCKLCFQKQRCDVDTRWLTLTQGLRCKLCFQKLGFESESKLDTHRFTWGLYSDSARLSRCSGTYGG